MLSTQDKAPVSMDSQPETDKEKDCLIRWDMCCDPETGRIRKGFLEEMIPLLDSEDEVQGQVENSGSKSHCQPHEGTEHTVVSLVCRTVCRAVNAQ